MRHISGCFNQARMAISTVFVFVVLQSVFVNAKVIEKPAEELKAYLSPVNTMQANFSQVTTDSKGKHFQTTKGSMQIKRPAFFRWQIKDPFSQLVVSNGKKVWVYDQELQQVTVRPLDEKAGNIPAAILSGNIKEITQNYSLKAVEKGSKKIFTLIPLHKDSLFDTLRLVFVHHELETMIMVDSLGTKTKIGFSNIKKNIPVKNSDFVLIPPPKVDVLDETQS